MKADNPESPSRPVYVAPIEKILLWLSLILGIGLGLECGTWVGMLASVIALQLAILLAVWRGITYILGFNGAIAPIMRRLADMGII